MIWVGVCLEANLLNWEECPALKYRPHVGFSVDAEIWKGTHRRGQDSLSGSGDHGFEKRAKGRLFMISEWTRTSQIL